MAYRAAFMGYSDLSGLIGTVLRFRGFRLSSQAGLFVFVPSADGATWLPASTDYDAILALFGWDVAAYRRGFADEDDAYAWLEAGAAYTAAPFLDQALATKLDRRWAASRPMYQQYLQRCRAAWKAPPATPGSADGGDVRVVNSPAARPPTAWEERVLKHCDLWPQYTALMADRALLDGFRPRFKASRIARTIDRGYGETARLRRALLAAHGSLRAMATALMPLDDAALAAYYRAAYAPLERSRALPGGNRDGGGVAEGSSSREARHEDPPAEHADRMRSRQDGHRGPECDPGGGDR
ncbi:hypothetical protein CXG81DRAFT_21152 [Caulochytrium protostelioides]|uniref:Uncharacterized protein n=1 Tax=Caulochytrium protostelioides TaxID=1555241 RepID=A0A4P9X0V6_9FUNG|nr:hypothetical protein CXG81DRAFT_21152 [Caulochytrium protostelioides]|eukprot:RKO98652.1 hypothetical protein CXG81DRAFT_21152 [Caulochytrium protostelioides]